MKRIAQTEHLELFDAGEFQSLGDFVTKRRLVVAFPRHEGVCHNMRPLATALIAYPCQGDGFIDRVELARPSEKEDHVCVDDLLYEFLGAVEEHFGIMGTSERSEYDPSKMLKVAPDDDKDEWDDDDED